MKKYWFKTMGALLVSGIILQTGPAVSVYATVPLEELGQEGAGENSDSGIISCDDILQAIADYNRRKNEILYKIRLLVSHMGHLQRSYIVGCMGPLTIGDEECKRRLEEMNQIFDEIDGLWAEYERVNRFLGILDSLLQLCILTPRRAIDVN